MTHLDLNDEERAFLSEALQSYLSNLSYEIANTDRQDFREQLKAKRAALDKIHKRLEPTQ